MFAQLLLFLTTHWLWTVVGLAGLYLARNYFCHGLNKYPGPFFAQFTNLWRFFDVLGRRPEVTHQDLHKKHGDVVRLGPNVLSFGNPRAIKAIYGLNKGFTKSEFYPVQQAYSNGKRLPSLFSTTDETFHANLRRCVNSAFSMTALVHYEPLVEEVLELFLDKTEQLYAAAGKVCNFSRWLQFYAFDVIGQITYSRRHGFIDDDIDVDNIVQKLGSIFNYVAPVGQMPWLDLVLLKNPVILLLDKLGLQFFQFPVAKFAKQRMTERLQVPEKLRTDGGEHASQRPDLLSRFLKAKEDRPEYMDGQKVLTMAVSMAFAGSETTAISLSAVFYYLLRNPRCYRKLQDELDQAALNGSIVDRPSKTLTWAEVQTLPYLDACIKEAFRLHPAAGLPLERITPPQGIEIDGHVVPGGTIVGCSAWVIHRCSEVFGDKVDEYIPERWLDSPPEKLKEMNGTMFQFGAGARTCIGKNISLLEIYKLVPAFLRRFEVSFEREESDWKLCNAWFVKQENFMTRFQVRQAA